MIQPRVLYILRVYTHLHRRSCFGFEGGISRSRYLTDLSVKFKLSFNNYIFFNRNIKIFGPCNYVGTLVKATDLRAGACLVLAGLAATGETIIEEAQHILRGYEDIQNKLNNVGANLKVEEI